MPRPAHPDRDAAVARARALLGQGKSVKDVRADMRERFDDVNRCTIKAWMELAQEEVIAAHPGELEDLRRNAIVERQARAKSLWALGYKAISSSAQREPDGVTHKQAKAGAFAAAQYFRQARGVDEDVAKLCHWYVIPPERDLESPEVRQIVATTIAHNAGAFELALLNDMIAGLTRARDEKLAETDVVDLAKRRAEMGEVL